MDKTSQVDSALNMCINNLNEWVCSSCATDNCDQPAAVFKLLRNKGYKFEETSSGKFGKKMFCPICGKTQTHYKLLSDDPNFDENDNNNAIPQRQYIRIQNILDNVEAYNLWKASSKPQVDKKTPVSREQDVEDISTLSNEEIKNRYQLLTQEHVALKNKACNHCMKYGIRPPFMGKKFYYAGDDIYRGTCEGCGWHDGAKWTAELNKLLDDYYRLKELEDEYTKEKNNYINYIKYLTSLKKE